MVYLSHEGPILGVLGTLQKRTVEESGRGIVPVHVCSPRIRTLILVVLGLGLC